MICLATPRLEKRGQFHQYDGHMHRFLERDNKHSVNVGGETVAIKVSTKEPWVPNTSSRKNNSDTEIVYMKKELLVADSEFLRAALKSKTTNSIDLSDECVSIFQIYFLWLYTGEIAFRGPETSPDEAQVTLAHAYVLGCRLGSPAFENAVLDTVFELVEENDDRPLSAFIEVLCAGAKDTCAADQSVNDCCAGSGEDVGRNMEMLVEEAICDIVQDVAMDVEATEVTCNEIVKDMGTDTARRSAPAPLGITSEEISQSLCVTQDPPYEQLKLHERIKEARLARNNHERKWVGSNNPRGTQRKAKHEESEGSPHIEFFGWVILAFFGLLATKAL
ncbi:hypothetical protein P280DRAFT_542339 [Massarina eburnea CBS 473.64]|uniref:BTB domain-containing protein n=1 Tax=Massarina eburnea CBS 473.64 TaxID=1395130 RepID=A0A6A6S1I1_9PLEO|nr:hypothetical protein P280DRAFT_542339 [Massarina eburnea CBS 473.64]